MTSMERVLTALSHKEPDRVPMFLSPTMHGAKELGISIKDYFAKAENVVEGQLRILKKYRNDCVSSFFYAGLEIEAFGGSVIFFDDGPPNTGLPFLRNLRDIAKLQPPVVKGNKALQKMLLATQMLKEAVKGDVPIIGVVISPFSLPVMQLGFDKYLELMYFHEDLFIRLMQINESFCVDWANAQLEAGATAIGYFDPVSSPTIIPREKYLESGFKVAQRTIAKIKGPTATHFASGNCLKILNDVMQTGTAVIGVSAAEDIELLKSTCKGKLTILGNLNGLEMRSWTPEQTVEIVRNVITKAAPGGGFILSDNHGEIPYQVSDEILLAISEAVHKYGNYPVGIEK
ncbi:MAG: uroporphyrinogen decarboxylase family protein [Ignavibacteriales bacterium]|nr:uroporphyrinogen decarboxylase family protein [Ignavibacteriales bacterium]